MKEQTRKELFQKLVRDANVDKNYFRDIKELFPEMFEDEQPKRVKKVFEVETEYHKITAEGIERCLISSVSYYDPDDLISVRELQTTKSKEELMQKIYNLWPLECWRKDVINNLINSHYPDSDEWGLLEEFVKYFSDLGYILGIQDALIKFKKLKGKK